MTDRSNRASGPLDAVRSPDTGSGTDREPSVDDTVQASAAPEPDSPDAPDAPQGSGLRRVTVSQKPLDEVPSSDRPSGERNLSGHDPEKPDPYLGCTIDDRYEVEKILGEGGMGVVYRCKHTIIGKKVAMKVLRADLARNQEVTERFLNEAKSASSIGNPHIIDISDFGRLPDGSTYFIMEYLEGQTLSALVDEGGPVPIERLVHIAEQLAEGLYAAHQAGIVHRDLKPDNIFLVERGGRDFVKILDFGIAKASRTEGKLTQAGQVFGTPHYMSPEQAAGTPIDHRADIYSLGVILYEMASGRVPFDADNFMGILTQHMYKSPVPIRSLLPEPQDVPPGVEAIILKCLSKRPEQRYATMRDLHADLVKAREGQIPDAVKELLSRSSFALPRDYFETGPLRSLVSTQDGRAPWPLYLGLGAVAGVLVLLGVVFARSGDPQPEPQVSAAPDTRMAAQQALPSSGATSSPTPAPSPAAVSAAPAPAPARKQVVLAVAPLDAHVHRGEEDLGTSPVLVELAEGETVTLRVSRKGYREAIVKVDGSEQKLSVALEPERTVARPSASAKASAPKPAAPKKPSSLDIVNPWE